MDTAALNLVIRTEGMAEAQRGLSGLESTAGMVEGAMKKMAAAFAAYEVSGWIKDAALLTARYDTLGVSMVAVGKNAGYTAQAMADYERALQATGISAIETRSTLTMMASAHIDMANASKLGRIAQDAAVIGNMNSSEAFAHMIHGIQSGQVEVLRTIGINVNFEASYKKLAAQLGKTTQDLSEVEKVTARTNAVMDKGRDIAGTYEAAMGTVGKQLKSMERYAQDLQVQLGEVFQPSMSALVESMAASTKAMSEWMVRNKDATTELGGAMAEVVRQSDGFLGVLKKIGGGESGDGGGGMWLATKGTQMLSLAIADLNDGISGLMGGMTWFLGASAKLGEIGLGKLIGGRPNLNADAFLKYGESLLDPLFSGNSAYDKWFKSTHRSGTSTELAYLNAADMSGGLDAGNNTYGFMERVISERRKADAEMARKASSMSVTTNTNFPKEDSGLFYFSLQPRIVNDIEKATTDALEYAAAMKGFEDNLKRLQAANLTTWDIIEKAVTHSSGKATDSLVTWMDNLDGVGRSWRTLGSTVSSVIHDMIVQMQRAVIQQQLMDPFFKWGMGELGKLFSPGTPAAGSTGLFGGATGGAAVLGGLANSGGSIESNVSVTINSSGQAESSIVGNSTELGKRIDDAVRGVLLSEKRQGGLLAAS